MITKTRDPSVTTATARGIFTAEECPETGRSSTWSEGYLHARPRMAREKKHLLDRRLARITTKLAALPTTEQVALGPPLTEQRVAGFEDTYGIRLPEEFRQFILHVGHAGYGPTYSLLPIRGSEGLATAFPFAADVEMSVPSADAGGFPGAITVVHRGCSDFTLLVVTGEGRGRLVEVNAEGFFSPRFHSDSDFLAWYERWLDFVLAGHRGLSWFADQMAGDEAELVATLVNSPVTARRRAAACTFITYATPSASLPRCWPRR